MCNLQVRSTEEGFHGSWHSARVIEAGNLIRRVRYTHLLDDNGVDLLVESIAVSPMIDGVVDGIDEGVPVNYRGVIRPIQPKFEFDVWGLSYGLCVDAFVDEAWWEGVIFDYEDGEEERLVFFPDLGDERRVKIGDLRVTHDWGEVSEKWVMREDWLFLELVEEHEKEQFVSVRQLWYDLRVKEVFRKSIKEWTCWVRPLWDSLVVEVIRDNVNLTAKYFLTVMESENVEKFVDCPSKRTRSSNRKGDNAVQSEGNLEDNVEENQTVRSFGRRTRSSGYNKKSDFMLLSEDVLHDNMEGIQVSSTSQEEKVLKRKADSSNILEETKIRKGSFEVKPDSPVEICATLKFKISTDSKGHAVGLKGNTGASPIERNNEILEPSDDLTDAGGCNPKSITLREIQVDPLSTSAESDTNLFTQIRSITDDRGDIRDDILLLYLSGSMEKSRHKGLATAIKDHLLSVGWKIDCFKDKSNQPRTYYISPKGKTLLSVPQVCNYLMEHKSDTPMMSPGSSIRQVPFLDSFNQNSGIDSYTGTSHGRTIARNNVQRETGGKGGVISLPKKLSLNCSKKKVTSADAKFVPEYCPEAVFELYQLGVRPKGVDSIGDLRLKAKKHLSAVGWTFRHIEKYGRRWMCYISPSPLCRRFGSLRSACKDCIKKGPPNGTRTMVRIAKNQESKSQLTCGSLSPESKEIQSANIEAKRIRECRKRGEENSCSFASMRIPSNVNASSSDSSEDDISLVITPSKTEGQTLYQSSSYQEQKKQKTVRSGTRKGDNLNVSSSSPVQRSNKRARLVVAPNPAYYTPRTILTWLIDNNVILPRDKVFCERRNQLPLEGKITRDGIRCNCCQKVFGISGFHDHAESTKRRPASSILLEDGRSLLDCQKQIIQASNLKSCRSLSYERNKTISLQKRKDTICSVCHYGGILVLCDKCPSAFHLPCVGLEIFMGLHKVLGKSYAAGKDNLSWTILKFSENSSDKDAIIAHSKLNVALSVMHECFEPIKEPHTKDLVKDVLFNKRSPLKRLDFRGFYTVLLERDDDLISVATVRVYGKKVAEVPLVGTRVQYRRQGMCRILMNILEQKFTELGIERLFLPAIPQLLHAWTTSFGFSQITNSQRSNFLQYTFLDFQGTTMCEKLLSQSQLVNDVSSPKTSDILQEVSAKGAPWDDCSSTEMVSPLAISTDMMWKNYEEKEPSGGNESLRQYHRKKRTPVSFCSDTLLLTNGKSSQSASI
ncbi:hypothetical protein ACHQM5_013621 [Ranunculus cassubicifolius]